LKRLTDSISVFVPIIVLILFFCIAVFYLFGIRINTSASICKGLYFVTNTSPVKGDCVIFCPPKMKIFDEAKARHYINTGLCPGGYGYMMKYISAAKGDTFSENNLGVFVNGKLLSFSRPLEKDMLGRALPSIKIKKHILNDDELLLMTNQSSTSFDSRYFGAITTSQIRAVVRPIFTW
jgi:conjugative transfer signal peptidase TraF